MPESPDQPVRSHFYTDRSGDLRKGYFYTFDICIRDAPVIIEGKDIEEEVIVCPRNPPFDELYEQTGEDYLTLEGIFLEMEDIKECPLDPTHVTQQSVQSSTYAVKENGRLADFIEDIIGDFYPFNVSKEFAEKIRVSGLTGWELTPAVYVAPENYGDHFEPEEYDPEMGIARDREFELFVLSFTGKPFDRIIQLRDAPNVCPFCGWGPLLCLGCGKNDPDCPQCKRRPITYGREDNYQGIEKEGLLYAPKTGDFYPPVLEAERYDGSDFIYPNYISQRALNWLVEQEAAPFYASPVYLDVSKATGKQLALINKAGCID